LTGKQAKRTANPVSMERLAVTSELPEMAAASLSPIAAVPASLSCTSQQRDSLRLASYRRLIALQSLMDWLQGSPFDGGGTLRAKRAGPGVH